MTQSILAFVAGAAGKATVLLAVAGLLTAVWRTSSASARHLVWTIAVASSLALPVVAAIVGGLGVPTVPVKLWTPSLALGAQTVPLAGEPRSPVSSARQPIGEPLTVPPHHATFPVGNAHDGGPTLTKTEVEASGISAGAAPLVEPRLASDWRTGVTLLWIAGMLAAFAPLLVAFSRVRLISRAARPARDPRWQRLIRETPAIAHLASRVRILESADAAMPMTWGFIHPTLLVPSNATAWSDWQCRNILLHELAHVERRDCLTQLVAQVACAVYWFNPLTWFAAHRMMVERELACDDCVITAGSPASDYAENLLDVARSLRAPSWTSSTAIAMARPSQLSGRLLAVLDKGRNRRALDRRASAGLSVGALVSVVVLASITTRAAVAAAAESPANGVPSPAVEVSSAGVSRDNSAAFVMAPMAIVQAAQVPTQTVPGAPNATANASQAMNEAASLAGRVDIAMPSSSAEPAPSAGLQQPCWALGEKNTNVNITTNDSKGDPSYTVRYTRPGCSFELRSEGKFTLRGDLSDIESLARDGWFRVEERDGSRTRRLEIRNTSGGDFERQYWVNGDRAAYDESARRWFADALLALERRTAFAAETRVPQLYRSRGLRGVLGEIDAMEGAYPRSKYYSRLMELEGEVNSATLNEIVQHASRNLASSDYYMSVVLKSLGKQRAANDATWRILADAAAKMKSDYYKSEVLKHVLAKDGLSSETVATMLRAASQIDSDHYLTELLKAIASRYALNAQTRSYYVAALGTIDSDHYRASLLESMNTSDKWDPRTTAFVLTSVGEMKSDVYKSRALVSLVKERHVDNWGAFFSAVASMKSDHYRRTTLVAALKHDPLTREIVAGVLGAAAGMGSDYEKSEVLSAVARSYRIDDEMRKNYERVVDSMSSEHYRGTALSALRRSMTRTS